MVGWRDEAKKSSATAGGERLDGATKTSATVLTAWLPQARAARQ